MRKQVTAGTLIVLIIGIALVWFFRPSQLGVEPIESKQIPLYETERSVASQLPNNPAVSFPSDIRQSSLTPSSAQDGVERWKERLHRPIEFFGKVVDEDGNPISGASISFSYNRFIPPEESFRANTRSDGNGLFSLSGVMGSTLSVHVEKEGYYPIKSTNRNYFNYTEDATAFPAYEPITPMAENPIIFRLKKSGEGAALITSRQGISPGLSISGLYNGSPVWVDFFHRKAGNTGQMELRAIKPQRGEAALEWWFQMSIPDGGFIQENDEFPFEAPDSGYQQTLRFEFKAGDVDWGKPINTDYYIAFGQPRKYGRIHVETAVNRGVYLQYFINPTGSRNLEPKEQTAIQRELPPGVTGVIPDYIKK